MNFLTRLLIQILAVLVAAYILPGVHISTFGTAVVLAIVLGILNSIIRPILIILTLPITILTLGLFTLVINAVLVLLAGVIVPGFVVDGFGWALLFGLVLSIVSWFLHGLSRKK